MPNSSSVVILANKTSFNLFLGIKAFSKNGKIGLPAGKLKGKETAENCIIRKCLEETGIRLTTVCYLDRKVTYNTYCFLYIGINYENELADATLTGIPSWYTRKILYQQQTSAFPEWNEWVFDRYDGFYKALGEGNMQVSSQASRSVRSLILEIEKKRLESIENKIILEVFKGLFEEKEFLIIHQAIRGRGKFFPENENLLNRMELILDNLQNINKLDILFMKQTLYRSIAFNKFVSQETIKRLLNNILTILLRK